MSDRDVYKKLYKAVQDYIENKGGSITVIGGVGIVHLPEDGKSTYRLVVKITGREPVFDARPDGQKARSE